MVYLLILAELTACFILLIFHGDVSNILPNFFQLVMRLKFKILSLDLEKERVSLGMKQLNRRPMVNCLGKISGWFANYRKSCQPDRLRCIY